MSPKNANQSQEKTKTNPHLKSSIVHKPFATGTINIFNPYRNKSKKNSNLSAPKLFLNAELEKTSDELAKARELELDLNFDLDAEPEEIEYRENNWLDSLLAPWGISAIAILFLVNLISAGFIWRNVHHTKNNDSGKLPISSIGNQNLIGREFMPLNLSTLGAIETAKVPVENTNLEIIPISPALAPLNNIASLSSFNPQYYYVLTEYTGEQSLHQARQKVQQVSLVNFPQGVLIYLGAFKDRQDAEQFVSQLKQENFLAYVYPLN